MTCNVIISDYEVPQYLTKSWLKRSISAREDVIVITILRGCDRKTRVFQGLSCFKLNNLRLKLRVTKKTAKNM